MENQNQPATEQASPIKDHQCQTRPVGTRAEGVQSIGAILNGFEKYLPEPVAPLTDEQLERRRQDREISIAKERKATVLSIFAGLVREGGRRFENMTLENYQAVSPAQIHVLGSLKRFVESGNAATGVGLVFFGPVGTGKDHLALATCRAIVERDCLTASWVNVQDWFGELRDRMDAEDSQTEHREIARLAKPDILILSEVLPPFGDIGQHMATMLYRVVEKRVSRNLSTFVTLNAASDEDAAKRMGRPTWDRLCDNAGKMFCNWPSYRGPAWKVNC